MKVAVLGLGSAGARHSLNLLQLGYEVVGFDPSASPPPGVASAASAGAAIEQAEAVVIASPSSLHAEQAIAALEAQRHVLVEKPLATTVADAERVVAAADRENVVCGVAMNLRFHPAIDELGRLVEGGSLGTILLAQASFGYDLRSWRPGTDYRGGYSARADLGGGIVFDAIHELDYLLALLGPVETVSAETARLSDLEIDVEDVGVALLRFGSGALGLVDVNFFEPTYRRGCLLVGSEAVARWDWTDAVITVRRAGDPDLVVDVETDVGTTYAAVLSDFLAAVQRTGAVRASAADGLAAVAVAEGILRSSQRGERITLAARRAGDAEVR